MSTPNLSKFDPEKYSGSRYSTVIGVAKRARMISEKAAEDKTILSEKPVKIAMTELMAGDYRIVAAEPKKVEQPEDNSHDL